MVYNFFDKKSAGSSVVTVEQSAKQVNTKFTPQNQQLAEELLYEVIIRKLLENLLLENLKKERYKQHLKIIFEVLS